MATTKYHRSVIIFSIVAAGGLRSGYQQGLFLVRTRVCVCVLHQGLSSLAVIRPVPPALGTQRPNH